MDAYRKTVPRKVSHRRRSYLLGRSRSLELIGGHDRQRERGKEGVVERSFWVTFATEPYLP